MLESSTGRWSTIFGLYPGLPESIYSLHFSSRLLINCTSPIPTGRKRGDIISMRLEELN